MTAPANSAGAGRNPFPPCTSPIRGRCSGSLPVRPVRRRCSCCCPVSFLVVGSFQDVHGTPTLQNYSDLSQQFIVDAYVQRASRSASSPRSRAGIAGFLLAYAIVLGRLPRCASGARADLLRRGLQLRGRAARPGVHLHPRPRRNRHALAEDSSISTSTAAASTSTRARPGVVYFYFQLPLMVLIMAPAIDGPEAGLARGGGEPRRHRRAQYWRTSRCRSSLRPSWAR